MDINTLRSQLNQLNQELSRLTGIDATALSFQAGTSEQDSLFLYGIVGGKDVGKTSLINQLAGARISIDTDVLDEGTKIAVAYCHRDDLPMLQQRLAEETGRRLTYIPHERRELKNVVLIDFPDFDSRFVTHRDDVQRLSKYLQSIVWVVSPRKYGDHEFMEQLVAVAQSNDNYYVVLNKFDQLEQKAERETVRQEILTSLTRECEKRKVPSPKSDRLFLLSALYPERYEYSKLHDRMIRIHSPEEIAKAKIKNLTAEFEKNLAKLDDHYSLVLKIDLLEKALDFIQTRVHEEFSDDYMVTVSQRVHSQEQRRRRISGELFSRRVEGWPILRSLFYPLAGIVSAFGGRFAFARQQGERYDSTQELFRYKNRSASARIQEIRDQIEAQFPLSLSDWEETTNYSEMVEQACSEFLQDHEDRVTERLAVSFRPPGAFRKSLVYLPLIWFPFLQPLLYQLIQREENIVSVSGLFEMLGILISLIGATSLLINLCFLLIFYMLWLIFFYSKCARLAIQGGEEEFQNTWYEQFIPWVTDVLSHPLQEVRTKLLEKSEQLELINQKIKSELQQVNESKL